jgi:hypothetical protein
MTKAEFFKYCARAEQRAKYPLRIEVGRIYREPEYAVFLYGLWANGSISNVQLYHPMPGRQWQHSKYIGARLACESAATKLRRWLEEWKTVHEYSTNPDSP